MGGLGAAAAQRRWVSQSARGGARALVAEEKLRELRSGVPGKNPPHFPDFCPHKAALTPGKPLQQTAAASSKSLRKCGLMSASIPHPWPHARVSLACVLLFLLACSPCLTAGRQGNCSHPVVPEHGGFRCEPSPCRGFPLKSSIYFFCEPGYHIPTKVRSSRCRHGKWAPPVPFCAPLKERSNVSSEEKVASSLPSVATTAVGVSIFLLTTTACLIIKSRLYPCHSHSRRSSDQLDLMVDGLPVSLPSYEEAVYGSWGQRLPACSTPGPTQLLLAQEAPSQHPSPLSSRSDTSCPSSQSPDNPPPPYEEVQSHRRERRGGIELSDDKDA